jgi:hypothetical protein
MRPFSKDETCRMICFELFFFLTDPDEVKQDDGDGEKVQQETQKFLLTSFISLRKITDDKINDSPEMIYHQKHKS